MHAERFKGLNAHVDQFLRQGLAHALIVRIGWPSSDYALSLRRSASVGARFPLYHGSFRIDPAGQRSDSKAVSPIRMRFFDFLRCDRLDSMANSCSIAARKLLTRRAIRSRMTGTRAASTSIAGIDSQRILSSGSRKLGIMVSSHPRLGLPNSPMRLALSPW